MGGVCLYNGIAHVDRTCGLPYIRLRPNIRTPAHAALSIFRDPILVAVLFSQKTARSSAVSRHSTERESVCIFIVLFRLFM